MIFPMSGFHWTHIVSQAAVHAEGLINPKVRAKKRLLISDTPEHVESPDLRLPTCLKT
jgi:hypothetical protein